MGDCCENCGVYISDTDLFRLTNDDVMLCVACYDECFNDD
jgi:hypothetical protein